MYRENEPENENMHDEEEKFGDAALAFQDKYRQLLNKYQLLLMKESMVSKIFNFLKSFDNDYIIFNIFSFLYSNSVM